jgi:hypothetical protein
VLSGVFRMIPVMRTRIEVPCDPVEKAAWEVAAGDVPLARWVRRLLNDACAERRVFTSTEEFLDSLDATPPPPPPPELRPPVRGGHQPHIKAPAVPPSFTPDFKRGKK